MKLARTFPRTSLLFVLFAASLQAQAGAQTIYYVDGSLTTGADNGSSWSNAYQGPGGLLSALDSAVSGDKVYVAEGTYLPSLVGDRFDLFEIPAGIRLFGGFFGGENTPEERPPYGAAPTVLSGDLQGDDASGMVTDNSQGIARVQGGNDPTVIDGLTLSGCNRQSTSGTSALEGGSGPLVVSNCVIRDNQSITGSSGLKVVATATIDSCLFEDNNSTSNGGGLSAEGDVTVVDCIFRGNQSFGRGGGLAMLGSSDTIGRVDRCLFEENRGGNGGGIGILGFDYSPTIQNCVIVDNLSMFADSGGGIICTWASSPTVGNCTIVGNRAGVGNRGGIATVQGASVVVVNSILWNNEGSQGAIDALTQIEAGNTLDFSIISGLVNGQAYPGTENSYINPKFVDLDGRDLRLALGSRGIDSGLNSGVPLESTLDFAGKPRSVDVTAVADTGVGAGPIVDRGAYEFRNPIGTTDSGCLPLPNSTGGPSSLTATGSLSLASADLEFEVAGLPADSFAYFLMSESMGMTPVGSGVLCLGNPVLHFVGDVLNSGPAGAVSFRPDLANLPGGAHFQVGETWAFQLWHRDGATSNFSDAVAIDWN